jgi:hypothetical protein
LDTQHITIPASDIKEAESKLYAMLKEIEETLAPDYPISYKISKGNICIHPTANLQRN